MHILPMYVCKWFKTISLINLCKFILSCFLKIQIIRQIKFYITCLFCNVADSHLQHCFFTSYSTKSWGCFLP